MKAKLLTGALALLIGTAGAQTPTLIKDFWTGLSGGYPSMGGLIYNGKYYFCPTETMTDRELWCTDGTTVGTTMVKDVNPSGPGSIGPSIVYNNIMYMTSNDGSPTYLDFYRSDGTSSGTYLLKDVCTDQYQSSGIGNYTIYNGILYFTCNALAAADQELWRTDGTTNGTYKLKDIVAGTGSSSPDNLFVWNGALYFMASTPANGRELWKTDGTSNGTVMVKDINAGTGGCINSWYLSPVMMGGYFYFIATDGVNGEELWRSDGTSGGTTLVKDINPGSASSVNTWTEGSSMLVFKNKLYFIANNGTNGRELWTSDGTNGGTVMLKDINPGATSGFDIYSYIVNAQDMKMYLRCSEGVNGFELWTSDGTSGGTVLVKDIYPGTTSGMPVGGMVMTLFGNLYFTGNTSANGYELWKSDGTNGGTNLFKDINPGTGSSSMSGITIINGIGYFNANNGTNGGEAWRTDFTPNGTVMIADINPGSSGSGANGFTLLGNKILFCANDGTNGGEMWVMNAITSVEEGEKVALNAEVYPNPAHDLLTIEGNFGKEAEITVLNSLGSVVHTQLVNGERAQVRMHDLPAGVYFVRVTNDNGVVTKKVIKD